MGKKRKQTATSGLSQSEAMELADRLTNALKLMNYIGFADCDVPAPEINFYSDNEQYYDSGADEIHLGVYGILDMFRPKDEEELLCAINFVRGHEEQHRRSTASRPYALAISSGCETVLEYIQFHEDGYKRKFRKASDYANYADVELPKKGIYISWNIVQSIIAGIVNSLEDGRIERIRSNRFPGFEALRMYHRGIFWEGFDDEYQPYAKLKVEDKLAICVNAILSLATCQLYPKGFAAAYASTPLFGEVNAFMPAIATLRTRCSLHLSQTRGQMNTVAALKTETGFSLRCLPR